MKLALFWAFIAGVIGCVCAHVEKSNSIPYTPVNPYGYVSEPICPAEISEKVANEFLTTIHKPIVHLFKKAASLSNGHFILSPFTIWMTLAAIAEGSEEQLQNRLNTFLNLPTNKCERQMFYKLAAGKEVSDNEVTLRRVHKFIFDSNVRINPVWERFVESNKLIDITSSPFKNSQLKEVEYFKGLINAQLPNLNLDGNSVILESLDYRGLWTKAFSDATIKNEPFYNCHKQQIGFIEFMKVKMVVKLAYIPALNTRIVEIPVGSDKRYRMFIVLPLGSTELVKTVEDLPDSILLDTLRSLKVTQRHIDVVLPRMIMTSEIDVKKIIEDFDLNDIWTSQSATRNISEPAALPSSYIQRVTATFDKTGVLPSIQSFSNFVPTEHFETNNDPMYTSDFIANRPFLFGFINTANYLNSFAGAFSII